MTDRVQSLQFRSHMRRLDKIQPIVRLATIYRALRGDRDAQREVTIEQVELYHYDVGMTFYEFVRSNWLPIYEEVLR